MLQLVKACLPAENVLQETLGSEVWKEEEALKTPAVAAADTAEDTAVAVAATEAAVKDVKEAVLKDADGTMFPGVAMISPIEGL